MQCEDTKRHTLPSGPLGKGGRCRSMAAHQQGRERRKAWRDRSPRHGLAISSGEPSKGHPHRSQLILRKNCDADAKTRMPPPENTGQEQAALTLLIQFKNRGRVPLQEQRENSEAVALRRSFLASIKKGENDAETEAAAHAISAPATSWAMTATVTSGEAVAVLPT